MIVLDDDVDLLTEDEPPLKRLRRSVGDEQKIPWSGNVLVGAGYRSSDQMVVPTVEETHRTHVIDRIASPETDFPSAGGEATQSGQRLVRSPSISSDSSGDESGDSSSTEQHKGRYAVRPLSCVAIPGPALPRSACLGWKRSLEPTREFTAVDQLNAAFEKAHVDDLEPPEYKHFRLDDFSIYRPRSPSGVLELVSLDRLLRHGFSEFQFDGILSVGDERYYVEGVPFRTLAIDGYGDLETTNLKNQICIQSPVSYHRNLWYQLGAPSSEYHRFYRPFLWLAHFTKYFVDYLLDHTNVTMEHFRRRFVVWLEAQHKADEAFMAWLAYCNLRDFRTTVAANVDFLIKECFSIDDRESGLCRQPIWGEIDSQNLTAIPRQLNVELLTVVTPYAYQCFKSMYFGHQLQVRRITNTWVKAEVMARKLRLKLTPHMFVEAPSGSTTIPMTPQSPPESLNASTGLAVDEGDVVCVPPNENGWKSTAQVWYAYVQRVRVLKERTEERTVLDVLWLYEAADTTLGEANYPFNNELFFSDNCSCGEDALDLDYIIGKVDVSFFATNPYAESGLFIRQKFRTIHDEDTYDFVSLQESDMRCDCDKKVPIFDDCRSKYAIGDTVLVQDWNKILSEDCLEPAQILRFDNEKRRVMLRPLKRRSRFDPNARPNELVPSSELFSKPASKVVRQCHVRYFERHRIHRGELPIPYDQGGAGDYYFITGQEASGSQMQTPPHSSLDSTDEADDDDDDNDSDRAAFPPIKEGWDPEAPSIPKLRGMGIFCGGGNFDRGLEEGGTVEFRYAIDWDEYALNSYRLNAYHPDKMEYFLGSVNDYLAQAMAGNARENIALPGEVNLISAGSPCPGFSMLQLHKLSDESTRNASMVASVVSYVDHYVPEYFILENVVNITRGMGPNRDENVFAQILAALVGLGYQIQQLLMDGWFHSSPQQRSRVFIIASAPGLPSLPPPQYTHAHPKSMALHKRALGVSSNGMQFGMRRNVYTPFEHISARKAVEDLPNIADSQVQLCPQFPDHRTATEERTRNRIRMSVVPTLPYEMGLIQAKLKGLIRGEPFEYCENSNAVRQKPNSRLYSRINPEGLFPTITTKLLPADGVNGRVLHWEQHRVITVMEAKRAQGYRDEEVIVGNPIRQLKIIGNSVDRKVSLVLGLALRESWMKASQDGLNTISPSDGGTMSPRESSSEPWTKSNDNDNDNDHDEDQDLKILKDLSTPAQRSSTNFIDLTSPTPSEPDDDDDDDRSMHLENNAAEDGVSEPSLQQQSALSVPLNEAQIAEVQRFRFKAIHRFIGIAG